KFTEVLADHKSDVILTLRDHWMDEFVSRHEFRPFYKWIHMACVDGHPQRPEWLRTYKNVDVLLSYSQYGKRVLEEESNGKLKVFGIAPPGVDTDVYRPLDKTEVRRRWNIDPNVLIVGTVMRNQQRKLFPRLIL